MKHDDLSDVYCSVARTWSVVGERWTMLILRECFRGSTHYENFKRKLGLGRNILTDRLTTLVAEGVLERRLYQTRPKRYEYVLTDKGEDLYPTMLTLMSWGDKYKVKRPPMKLVHRKCGNVISPQVRCEHCDEPIKRRDLTAQFAKGAW